MIDIYDESSTGRAVRSRALASPFRPLTKIAIDQLPTLSDIAESGTGMTLWFDNDDCAYRRDNGHRYQVIYETEDLAAFAETYGPGVGFYRMAKAAALLGVR